MKKVNFTEASAIVGGTCTTTCTVRYVKNGNTCNAVTTCVDKNGKVLSTDSKSTTLTNCGIIVEA